MNPSLLTPPPDRHSPEHGTPASPELFLLLLVAAVFAIVTVSVECVRQRQQAAAELADPTGARD